MIFTEDQLIQVAKIIKERISKFQFRRVVSLNVRQYKETRKYNPDGTFEIVRRDYKSDNDVTVDVARGDFSFWTGNSLRGDEPFFRVFAQGYGYCDIDEYLNLSPKQGTNFVPKIGDLICGLVEREERGPKFVKWFVCSEQLMRAYTAITFSNHKSFQTEDEVRLREKLFSGNRLATNTFKKWSISQVVEGREIKRDDVVKRFHHLRTETPSKEWVHVYCCLVLFCRYGELPDSTNIPQNKEPGAAQMISWSLPENYVKNLLSLQS